MFKTFYRATYGTRLRNSQIATPTPGPQKAALLFMVTFCENVFIPNSKLASVFTRYPSYERPWYLMAIQLETVLETYIIYFPTGIVTL